MLQVEERVPLWQYLVQSGGNGPGDRGCPGIHLTVKEHALDGGDGCEIFADNTCLIEGGMADCQVLIDYIQKELKGDLSAYDHTEGRITIE